MLELDYSNPGPELLIQNVVPFEYEGDVSFLVHFGLHGLHFIVTDSDLLVQLLKLNQCVCDITGDLQHFTIPFIKYLKELNGPDLSRLIYGFIQYKDNPSVMASTGNLMIPTGSQPQNPIDCYIQSLSPGLYYSQTENTLNSKGRLDCMP